MASQQQRPGTASRIMKKISMRYLCSTKTVLAPILLHSFLVVQSAHSVIILFSNQRKRLQTWAGQSQLGLSWTIKQMKTLIRMNEILPSEEELEEELLLLLLLLLCACSFCSSTAFFWANPLTTSSSSCTSCCFCSVTSRSSINVWFF